MKGVGFILFAVLTLVVQIGLNIMGISDYFLGAIGGISGMTGFHYLIKDNS